MTSRTASDVRSKKVSIDSLRSLTTPSTTMEFSHRTLIQTATASLVAGMLALPTSPVLAAPSSPSSPDAAETVDAEEASAPARDAFEQGLDAYEAGDYAAAVRHWTEAHDLMGESPELSGGRRVLGFDLAQAQMRAHAADGDPRRLDAARPLLEAYIAWVDRPGHTMDEGEKQDRARAVELLAQIDREDTPPAPVPPRVDSAPPSSPPPPATAEPKPTGTGLLIGGGVALAGGIGSIVGAVVSEAAGSKAEDAYNSAVAAADSDAVAAATRAGRRANVGFIASTASAVLLTAAGVTMLAIGGRRRKRYISASAALTPSSAGASMSVRF